MKTLLLILLGLVGARSVDAQNVLPCDGVTAGTMFWGVRITFAQAPACAADPVSGVTECRQQPWASWDIGCGEDTPSITCVNRETAVAWRNRVVAEGFAWPNITPGPPADERGETRVAPAAILYASVKRFCCRMDLPLPDRPACVWPDGDAPPHY